MNRTVSPYIRTAYRSTGAQPFTRTRLRYLTDMRRDPRPRARSTDAMIGDWIKSGALVVVEGDTLRIADWALAEIRAEVNA